LKSFGFEELEELEEFEEFEGFNACGVQGFAFNCLRRSRLRVQLPAAFKASRSIASAFKASRSNGFGMSFWF